MTTPLSSPGSERFVVAAIVVLLLVWFAATAAGLVPGPASDEHPPAAHAAELAASPPLWSIAPFVALLAAIAVLPLVEATHHWWENNLHRFYVAGGAALATLLYYAFLDVEHGGLPGVGTVLKHAVLEEYIPFVVLLFSLFVVAGGIRISGDLPATPATNTAFLAVGTLLASFVGTTGAAMIIIRPLLETNRERKHVVHTVVFFIFLVCNCGGCLLPIGDPPLFLGYLEGVPFLWTLGNLWLPWLAVNSLLLAIYYVWDRFFAYPHETPPDLAEDQRQTTSLAFEGLGLNLPLLAGIVLAVGLLDPSRPLLGTAWHPWPYLREAVQLVMAALSLGLGPAGLRERNQFNYAPILEVAALFIGIFITMQPALAILEAYGDELRVRSPFTYFWATGGLSALLDNAPTYLVFFRLADSQAGSEHLVDLIQSDTPAGMLANQNLVGISLGAVFLGAMTYIGNGPNFMVKSIAEEAGVKMPSFFAYCLYSAAVLLPVLALVSWLMFSL